MRQIIVIILKRLIIALFALCGIIRRIFTCQWIRRNQQRIGELPTFITNKKENLTEFTGFKKIFFLIFLVFVKRF